MTWCTGGTKDPESDSWQFVEVFMFSVTEENPKFAHPEAENSRKKCLPAKSKIPISSCGLTDEC